jgi:diadenosine tetraphosphatase ApaH/serine/threonine PP2A family protein phosphatase
MPSSPTIAVLADVHGNMPALEAVLADIERLAPDEILVGGDLVGRGPQGSRVVATIRDAGWPTIRGNHEDYLLDFRRRRVPEQWWRQQRWAASRWMAEELSPADADWIERLPPSLRSATEPGLLLVHGTPESANDGLGPWTEDGELSRHLAAVDAEILICGHTHRPMDRRLPEGRVVNVGSVGLPFNHDPRAQYALFHRDENDWRVEARKVEYDRRKTFEVYERTGFLREGGITAELLKIELENSTAYLVPFLKWSELTNRRPGSRALDSFLAFYDPDLPMHEQFRRLATTAGGRSRNGRPESGA